MPLRSIRSRELGWESQLWAIKIYVGNLPYETTGDDLVELFQPYGTIVSGQVVVDRFSGRSRGFGFVEMSDENEAQAAIDALHDQPYGGRPLKVNESRPRTDASRRGYGGGGGGYGGGGLWRRRGGVLWRRGRRRRRGGGGGRRRLLIRGRFSDPSSMPRHGLSMRPYSGPRVSSRPGILSSWRGDPPRGIMKNSHRSWVRKRIGRRVRLASGWIPRRRRSGMADPMAR